MCCSRECRCLSAARARLPQASLAQRPSQLPFAPHLQGQAAVRINQTRLEWRTITNPPSVQRYSVRLERLVNNKAQLAASTSVPAADAGKDVAFNGLAAGQYQVRHRGTMGRPRGDGSIHGW